MTLDGYRIANNPDDRQSGQDVRGRSLPDEAGPAVGPVSRGVALTLDGEDFTIVVRTGKGGALRLGPYSDDEVVAVWRAIAASSGLPLLVEDPDGELIQPYPQIGRLLVGPVTDGRHLKVLAGRRPRFLVRRRGTRLPAQPVVHREREITAGRSV